MILFLVRIFFCILSFLVIFALSHDKESDINEFFEKGSHTNNWAVLVCSSRYWFNYRHVANVLSIYRSVKRLGIPDSRIILMLADDMPCNSRNPRPGTVFNNVHHHINVFDDYVEIDYRGYDVTVANFIRLLTGRVSEGTPKSKQLLTDEGSNILIYMTGHGGEGFLKFQDSEQITNIELADALEQMWQKGRYNEILMITETCQAESMAEKIYSPNVLGIGSSKIGEVSYSHHGDQTIGVHVIDRYTYYALEFLETISINSTKSLTSFLNVCPKRNCISTVAIRSDLFKRDTNKVPLIDFFGSIPKVKLIDIGSPEDAIKLKMRKVAESGFTLAYSSASNVEYFPIETSI